MMSSSLYMLDTDTSSYLIKGRFPEIQNRLATVDSDQICISCLTRAELRFDLRRKIGATALNRLLEEFLRRVTSLAWNADAADEFAAIRFQLENKRTPIGVMDTMIAAHAKSLDAILVTNNMKHYRLVKNLRLQNWAQ